MSDIVNGGSFSASEQSDARTHLDFLDGELDWMRTLVRHLHQQIAEHSVRAIGHIVRSELADATGVGVDWSDEGSSLVPDGGYLTHTGVHVELPGDLVDRIRSYCENLAAENELAWMPLAIFASDGRVCYLSVIDGAITEQARIACLLLMVSSPVSGKSGEVQAA